MKRKGTAEQILAKILARWPGILETLQLLITITIVLGERRIGDSSIPKFELTVPWPGCDRLAGNRWATVSGMITIAKVHFRENITAGFESPSGTGTRGGLPVSLNTP
jgi:hypothetical protein